MTERTLNNLIRASLLIAVMDFIYIQTGMARWCRSDALNENIIHGRIWCCAYAVDAESDFPDFSSVI